MLRFPHRDLPSGTPIDKDTFPAFSGGWVVTEKKDGAPKLCVFVSSRREALQMHMGRLHLEVCPFR